MKYFKDQTNRKTGIINFPPERIVSVVPSQTELLFDLGLEQQVVGITKFCVHPKIWFQTKTKIGGTKQLHVDKIRALQPDLIIANKEENNREQIEALAAEFPVWVSDVKNLDDALDLINRVGEITATDVTASKLRLKIEAKFKELPSFKSRRVVYLIWRKPFMTVGGDTFIQSMLEKAALQNMFASHDRYPEVTAQELSNLEPDIILLSSEPYPFQKKHISEIQELCPRAAIVLVNGELFSWYGSRLLHTPPYLCSLVDELNDR